MSGLEMPLEAASDAPDSADAAALELLPSGSPLRGEAALEVADEPETVSFIAPKTAHTVIITAVTAAASIHIFFFFTAETPFFIVFRLSADGNIHLSIANHGRLFNARTGTNSL